MANGGTALPCTITPHVMFLEPARNELPNNIQQEYTNLEVEYKEGDITDKGFKKKKMKLLKPYLVAGVSSYCVTS